MRLKLVVVAILGLCLAFSSPQMSWALGGEELVNILREEKVITVDQAEKIKKKVRKVEKKEHLDWKAYWKNGLIIESKDGKNEIKMAYPHHHLTPPLTRYLFVDIGLDRITDFPGAVAFDPDTTFIAGLNLSHIVLKSLQR